MNKQMVDNDRLLDVSIAPSATETGRNFTVSLIIPTLNEAENLPLVFSYIPFDWVDEVVLVDGRSTDNTVEVARSLLPDIKIVLEEMPGKGCAMQSGYLAATGDILILLDADGSHDPREIPRFIQALLEGADFVKGSRFAPQGGTTDMDRLRLYGNWGFVKLTNLLFNAQFSDLLYGYHAFWRYCLDLIDLKGVDGFEIDAYLYLQAVRNKLRIVDVPSFEGYRFHGSSNLKTFPDGWRVLKTITKEWIGYLRTKRKDYYLGFRSTLPTNHDPSALRMHLRQSRLEQQAKLLLNSGGLMLNNVLQLLGYSVRRLPEDASYKTNLADLVSLTMKELNACCGSLMVLDENGRLKSSYTMQNGRMRSINPRKVAPALVYGLAGWVVKHQQPAVVDNTLEDSRWLKRDWELRKGIKRSAVGFPLLNEDRVQAVLTLMREEGPFFKDGVNMDEPEIFLGKFVHDVKRSRNESVL